MFKNAIRRYRVARFYGLPTKICIKAFFFSKGNPIENFELALKLQREKMHDDEGTTDKSSD